MDDFSIGDNGFESDQDIDYFEEDYPYDGGQKDLEEESEP